MSIEKVKERIVEKAQFEAKEFLLKEKKKIEKEKELYRESLKEEFNERLKVELGKIENDVKRKIDQKKLELDRAVLSKKRAILDEIFSLALKKFLSIDSANYAEFLEKLILNDAPLGESFIVVNKKDKKIINEKFIAKLNKKLGKGRKVSLSDETAEIKGGCIIKSKDVEIDVSIETLLADERDSSEMEIAKSLFGADK